MAGLSEMCTTTSNNEHYPVGLTSRQPGLGCVAEMSFSGGIDEQSKPSEALVGMGLSARFGPMKAVGYPVALVVRDGRSDRDYVEGKLKKGS